MNLRAVFLDGFLPMDIRKMPLPTARLVLFPIDIFSAKYSIFGMFLHHAMGSFKDIYEFGTDYGLLIFPAALDSKLRPGFFTARMRTSGGLHNTSKFNIRKPESGTTQLCVL